MEKVKTEKSIGFRKEEKHESNNEIKCSEKDKTKKLKISI